MISLSLLELVLKQFPTLNFDLDEDIIKVEKILKAEAKLDNTVKINDIEQLISFLRTYGNRFVPILKNKNISIIVAGKPGTVNFAPLDRNLITDETLEQFEQAFSENISEYLKQCIRNNAWNSLRSIFINYSFLISDNTRSEVYEILSLKNQSIISALLHNQYVDYVALNAYAEEIQYYSFLSSVDPHFFDDDILRINNIICEKQKTTIGNKIYLGKILYAATFFNAYTESLKETLENNQQIALQWIHPGQQITDNGSRSSTTMTIIIIIAVILVIVIAISANAPGVITPTIIIVGFLARLANHFNKK